MVKEISSIVDPPNVWMNNQDKNIGGSLFTDLSVDSFLYVYDSNNGVIGGLNKEIPEDYSNSYGKDSKWYFLTFEINYKLDFIIDAEIYDESGCIVGEINRNIFTLNDECMFTYNKDDTAFEVIDNNNNVVFNLEIYKNKALLINSPKKDGIQKFHRSYKTHTLTNRKSIKRIFQYCGEECFGKRAVYPESTY